MEVRITKSQFSVDQLALALKVIFTFTGDASGLPGGYCFKIAPETLGKKMFAVVNATFDPTLQADLLSSLFEELGVYPLEVTFGRHAVTLRIWDRSVSITCHEQEWPTMTIEFSLYDESPGWGDDDPVGIHNLTDFYSFDRSQTRFRLLSHQTQSTITDETVISSRLDECVNYRAHSDGCTWMEDYGKASLEFWNRIQEDAQLSDIDRTRFTC